MRSANRFRGFNDEELRAETRENVQALRREANEEIARRRRNEEADAAERGGHL